MGYCVFGAAASLCRSVASWVWYIWKHTVDCEGVCCIVYTCVCCECLCVCFMCCIVSSDLLVTTLVYTHMRFIQNVLNSFLWMIIFMCITSALRMPVYLYTRTDSFTSREKRTMQRCIYSQHNDAVCAWDISTWRRQSFQCVSQLADPFRQSNEYSQQKGTYSRYMYICVLMSQLIVYHRYTEDTTCEWYQQQQSQTAASQCFVSSGYSRYISISLLSAWVGAGSVTFLSVFCRCSNSSSRNNFNQQQQSLCRCEWLFWRWECCSQHFTSTHLYNNNNTHHNNINTHHSSSSSRHSGSECIGQETTSGGQKEWQEGRSSGGGTCGGRCSGVRHSHSVSWMLLSHMCVCCINSHYVEI